jgi:cephalosporin-C deacetylase-like acetyl esterase
MAGLLLAALVAASPETGARAQKGKGTALSAHCDRPDATYKVGESVEFKVQADADGEVTYRLSEDGFKAVEQGKLTVRAGETGVIKGKLDKPGFLQLSVARGKDRALAAAAFDPTKIQPTAEEPADFDAFWAAGLKELAKVPVDAQLEHSKKHSDSRVDCYRISLANVGGKRVRGWVSVPKVKGPFPAILTVPGAGVYGITPDRHHAYLGAVSMNIIIHDIPVDESADFYKKQSAGPLTDYRDIGMDDPQKSYYRAVILGCARSIDYLAGRPDHNGEVAVTGVSQGGGLTLITSGLDARVRLAAPSVAAMCDHSGVAHGRVSGWPHWLTRVKGERAKKVLQTSAYFDAVNFARRFKGKSLHHVGFIDTVCAPTTVYAAYNVHPEPKVMVAEPLVGHAFTQKFRDARDAFWKANLALKPPPGK